jgi:DNA ligase-1
MNIVFDETLYGVTKTGAIYTWHVYVVHNPNDTGTIFIERGLIDGKKHVTQETIKKGKNIGKVNETTAVGQAIFNAESKRNSKLDSGYDYTIEASQAKFNDQLKPMLAQSFDKHKKKLQYPCFAQPKLDGIRCVARKRDGVVTLYSRKGKVLDLVPHINEALEAILEDEQCVDGELYTHGWDFQKIISAIKKTSEDTPGIEYHIYDFPNKQNEDEPFSSRFSDSNTSRVTQAGAPLVLTETVTIYSEEELLEYETKALEQGYEGIMARNTESKYLFGYRSKDLLKVKQFQDAEYKIIGVTDGVSIEEGLAIFTCVTSDGLEFSVRPMGTHDERKVMFENKDSYIGKLLTVKYQELSNDNIPRFPVGLHIRETWDM